jgi:hypothetical protein
VIHSLFKARLLPTAPLDKTPKAQANFPELVILILMDTQQENFQSNTSQKQSSINDLLHDPSATLQSSSSSLNNWCSEYVLFISQALEDVVNSR